MVDYAMLACFYQHYVYDDKTNNGNYLTRMFTTKSVVKWKLLLVMVVLKSKEPHALTEGERNSFKY